MRKAGFPVLKRCAFLTSFLILSASAEPMRTDGLHISHVHRGGGGGGGGGRRATFNYQGGRGGCGTVILEIAPVQGGMLIVR